MSVSRSSIGFPCTWSIGAAGDPNPDHYPARLVSRPRLSTLNGRTVEVADIIALRTNKDGVDYTSERLVNTRFLSDRTKRVEALDGTAQAPKQMADLMAEHQASIAEFQSTQSQELSVDALAAVLAD